MGKCEMSSSKFWVCGTMLQHHVVEAEVPPDYAVAGPWTDYGEAVEWMFREERRRSWYMAGVLTVSGAIWFFVGFTAASLLAGAS